MRTRTNVRWMTVLMLGLVCLMVAPGCRKTRKGTGSGLDDNVIGGVRSDELGLMGEYGLDGMRIEDSMTPYPGEFAPVYFDYDSAQLRPGERGKADAVAAEMRGAPQTRLVVEGHCDERGDLEYNLALGERRALAVRAYIVELGVDPGRITTRSYGEENPAALGHDEASYQLNRRAELRLFMP